MQHRHWIAVAGIAAAFAAPAAAGELPLYQPAPPWVAAAPALDSKLLAANGPPILILDFQQRIEDGRLWSYTDSASRISSSEMLGQLATLALPWAPDKGDLIVHELSILRGTERIDLLARGQKFTVLRREELLEQRQLTGILTATLETEGLQVGDVLRLRISTTAKDQALGGRVQSVGPLIAAPARIGFGRMLLSWPAASAPQWKLLAEGVAAAPTSKGSFTELSLTLPAPKQTEMPSDAPRRYHRPPLIELSTFSGWADVSKVMAPLYVTKGAIAPGSPLAAEVAAIMKADATPIGRAQRALELVQDKIRYLAVGMDGGNYVPQTTARTWEARYGDCKAKTLVLLAMLREMGIEAEPVLAHIMLGDLVPQRLPSAQAFNHVLVRAVIDGESFWLDGTGSGSRLPDIRDIPPLRHVLPIREAGAELVALPARAPARPMIDISVEADESASLDLPSVFEATAVVRGEMASMLALAVAQLGEKEKREAASGFFQGFMGEAQFASATAVPDAAAGTVTLSARGVVTTPWETDERRRKRHLSQSIFEFAPDRGRPAWKAIPVASPGPMSTRFRLRLRLPEGGRGYTLEGEPNLNARLAGHDKVRTVRLEGGVVTLDERDEATGAEIAAADIPAERDKVATAKAQTPRIVAPQNALRRWDFGAADPAGATQIKAAEAVFAKAIANDPEEATAYVSRASFRSGIGDLKGARADLGRALAIEPSVELYLKRSDLAAELGDLSGALADAEAARQLDPSSSDAIQGLARLKAEQGDLKGAVALVDERIVLGGDTREGFQQLKAALVGEFGAAAEGLKLYDALVEEMPGSPTLLNGRCWVKGLRAVALESALRDCTEAIELSSRSNQALDSRALVYYRLGRDEEALRDLDSALAVAPGQAASRYLRAAVLTRMKRGAEAAKELAIARRLSPTIDKGYVRYGIKL